MARGPTTFVAFLLSCLLLALVSNAELTLTNVLQLDDDGRIFLAWEPDHEREVVTFEIEASTTGYVGFGISPYGSMTGADIFIGGVGANGVPYFSVNSMKCAVNL